MYHYNMKIIIVNIIIDFLEDLYALDEQGEVSVFNTRTNPALQTNTWTYDEQLGEQLRAILVPYLFYF